MSHRRWVYHATEEAKIVDSETAEELYKQGWCDHPDKCEVAESVVAGPIAVAEGKGRIAEYGESDKIGTPIGDIPKANDAQPKPKSTPNGKSKGSKKKKK